MGYLGSQPATNFESFKKDRYTSITGTGITLSHSVSSVQDIIVWVNSVKQDYTSYSVNGTALTLGGSLVSSDITEVAYIGKTFQTVNPAADSVTASQIANNAVSEEHLDPTIITGLTALGATPADTDELLISDAGTLKSVDFSHLKGGGKINQVLYQSTVFDSSHSSDTQVATLSITPSSASSTILIMSTIVAQLDSGEYGSVDIYRGTLASGSKVFDASDVFFHNAGNGVRCHYTFSYIDSPSTTSAQSYSIVISPQFSGTVRYGCGASNMLQLWEILP